jgi:hypothetical protein
MFMPEAVFKDADGEPWRDPTRHNRMANFVGELLIAAARSLIAEWTHAAILKAGAWLDGKIGSRTAKLVAGMLLGLAAFILIPILTGLVGL